MQRIEIDHAFAKPVERVYAHLAEHENLGPLFGAKVTRVRDGDSEAIENELIRYRITKSSPLRGHHGELRFTPQGTGSHLRYVIEFGAVVPGLDRVIKLGLERSVRAALPRVDERA